eukprot:m.81182 g.81182  ORF g.81182 m.81182 type:complete len:508 (-) comp13356_c0_seq5:34-1557(-)
MTSVSLEPSLHTVDGSLSLLRFAVVLRKVTAASRAPVAGGVPAEEGIPLINLRRPTVGAAPTEEELVEIQWQEKIYCSREVAHYGLASNCVSETDLSHHAAVAAQVAANAGRTRRIFTLTSGEKADLTTTLLNDHPAPAAEPPPRRPRPVAVPPTHASPIVHPHWRASAHSAHVVPPDAMFIMADLGHTDHCPGPDEHVLAVVQVSAQRLSVRPALGVPRRIETMLGDVFDCEVDPATTPRAPEAAERAKQAERGRDQRRAEIVHTVVGSDFVSAPHPPGALRLHVFGEIVAAWGYVNSILAVRGVMALPPEWLAAEGAECTFSSQQCATTCIDDEDVAFFSMPFEIAATCNAPDPATHWPRINIQVSSRDSWGRYQVQGYASQPLPPGPGTYEWVLRTWRPAGHPADEMRRYFVGGGEELEDLAALGNPAPSPDGKAASMLFLQTRTTGFVRLRVNIVHHRHNIEASSQQQQQQPEGPALDRSLAQPRARLRTMRLPADPAVESQV